MRATAFPYYTPPFAEYNVAQQAVIPFLDKDLNLVVSFATAAGKTVLAECCFGYHLKTDEKCRVAYVCPFKSLASEKFGEWKENSQFKHHGLVLSSTDSKSGLDDHMEARMAVVTCESFDAKTRSGAYRDWLRSLSCVVYDECFSGESSVVTDRGIMTIDNVIACPKPLSVLSYCHRTKKAEFKRIVAKRKKMLHRLWYSITYSTGHIEVTAGQPVWVDGLGYVRADTVREGDVIYVNKEFYSNDTGGREHRSWDSVGGWKPVCYGNGKECKAEGSTINFAEATCKVEVQKVEKIGFDPSQRCSQRGLWKRTLSFFYTLISRVIGYKESCLSSREKGRDDRLAVEDKSPSGISGVVHGRRKSGKKCNENPHRGVFKSGERNAFRMAIEKMGSFMQTLQGREVLAPDIRCGRQGCISEHHARPCDSGHGIQVDAKTGNGFLLNVRQGISDSPKANIFKQKNHAMWFRGMFRKVEKNICENGRVFSACYDIEVEDNCNLFVDGVLCHNCHLMNDKSRGGAVEASMMRLTTRNPNVRLILLSATMGNAKELAKWVKLLNGKATKCVVSSWRPSIIETDYVVVDGNDEKVDEAVRLALEAKGKVIVFVHSKFTGTTIVKRLRKAGTRAVFHNASVKPGTRAKMERAFNDRTSGLNILVSTSTLGAGVNIG